MGNCMEALSKERGEEEEDDGTTTRKMEEEEEGEKKGRMRIKVVLSKEELEWLMEQIKERSEGGKGLEELLEEIEKGRGRGNKKIVKSCIIDGDDDDGVNNSNKNNASWKPSLESIMECPEVPDQMQR